MMRERLVTVCVSVTNDNPAELGVFIHPAESEMLCKSTNDKVPYFNADVYLENKTKIGKVEEILGPINGSTPEPPTTLITLTVFSEVHFTIKLDPGINANSYQKDHKFFINPAKLLPMSRFTNPGQTLQRVRHRTLHLSP